MKNELPYKFRPLLSVVIRCYLIDIQMKFGINTCTGDTLIDLARLLKLLSC